MPFDLLLLPLLGGYLLVSRAHLFAFEAAKQSGQRLVFKSALVAVGLVVLARLIGLTATEYVPQIGIAWREFSPLQHSGTALLALILGMFGPWLINYLVPLEAASRLAVQKHGSGLDKLFFAATETDSQVLITLDTGKVYAGWIDWAPPNPGAADAYIRILPTVSGHRMPDTTVEWTSFYQNVYLGLAEDTAEEVIESFTKVIPISRVVTAGMFDPILYDRFDIGENKSGENTNAV